MTYSISLSGHGASADDAKEVFTNTVRALRIVNAENPSPSLSGQISGSGGDGTSFSLTVADVTDAEEEVLDEDEEDVGEAPEDGESEAEAGTEP